MKELLKLSTILTVICFGAALALGCVYELTKEPIARQQQLKKQRAIAAVFPDLPLGKGIEGSAARLCDDDSPAPCREYFRLVSKELVSGIALETVAAGYGGPIDLMVGLLPDGTLSGITIINHTETPGLGANITKESFCGQFTRCVPAEGGPQLKKNGGTIDHVTGATISSAAVLQAVQEQVVFFKANRSRIMSAQTEAHRGP
jgi:electron transport complex protein RnfG